MDTLWHLCDTFASQYDSFFITSWHHYSADWYHLTPSWNHRTLSWKQLTPSWHHTKTSWHLPSTIKPLQYITWDLPLELRWILLILNWSNPVCYRKYTHDKCPTTWDTWHMKPYLFLWHIFLLNFLGCSSIGTTRQEIQFLQYAGFIFKFFYSHPHCVRIKFYHHTICVDGH